MKPLVKLEAVTPVGCFGSDVDLGFFGNRDAAAGRRLGQLIVHQLMPVVGDIPGGLGGVGLYHQQLGCDGFVGGGGKGGLDGLHGGVIGGVLGAPPLAGNVKRVFQIAAVDKGVFRVPLDGNLFKHVVKVGAGNISQGVDNIGQCQVADGPGKDALRRVFGVDNDCQRPLKPLGGKAGGGEGSGKTEGGQSFPVYANNDGGVAEVNAV